MDFKWEDVAFPGLASMPLQVIFQNITRNSLVCFTSLFTVTISSFEVQFVRIEQKREAKRDAKLADVILYDHSELKVLARAPLYSVWFQLANHNKSFTEPTQILFGKLSP